LKWEKFVFRQQNGGCTTNRELTGCRTAHSPLNSKTLAMHEYLHAATIERKNHRTRTLLPSGMREKYLRCNN
jgi:hypothetical protein